MHRLVCIFLFLPVAALFLSVPPVCPAAARSQKLSGEQINYLVDTFEKEKFDREFLQRVFGDPRVRYTPGPVKLILEPKSFAANYKRFLKPPAIKKARNFSRKWNETLEQTASSAGVDPGVVVAIMLVETGLGAHLGSNSILSVFSSLVLANQNPDERALARKFPKDSERQKYLRRLAGKARWARGELRSLMTMHRDMQIDIFELKGSYAGAFGLPQFLPSSYLRWARDGDEKHSIDLFCVPDAAASVASFLKGHGWRPGLSSESQKKVLWKYNRSKIYVETVLEVAQKLRTEESASLANLSLKASAVSPVGM